MDAPNLKDNHGVNLERLILAGLGHVVVTANYRGRRRQWLGVQAEHLYDLKMGHISCPSCGKPRPNTKARRGGADPL